MRITYKQISPDCFWKAVLRMFLGRFSYLHLFFSLRDQPSNNKFSHLFFYFLLQWQSEIFNSIGEKPSSFFSLLVWRRSSRLWILMPCVGLQVAIFFGIQLGFNVGYRYHYIYSFERERHYFLLNFSQILLKMKLYSVMLLIISRKRLITFLIYRRFKESDFF